VRKTVSWSTTEGTDEPLGGRGRNEIRELSAEKQQKGGGKESRSTMPQRNRYIDVFERGKIVTPRARKKLKILGGRRSNANLFEKTERPGKKLSRARKEHRPVVR